MNNLYIKRILIHILLVIFYLFAGQEIRTIATENLDTLVLFVGLIVIAPITSYFVYSYKNNNSDVGMKRGHITTFASAMVIGMLFVILDILLLQMIGNIFAFRITILLFRIAVVSFDFADFEK